MSNSNYQQEDHLSLEDRILRMAATDATDLPDFPDDKSDLPSDFEYHPEDYEQDEEEIVEEISESELLKYLEHQESGLSVAQRLFYHELNTTEYQRNSGSWDLNCLTPEAVEELYSKGWTELEGQLDLDTLKGAHEESVQLLEQGQFIPARSFSENDPYRDTAARDDSILWFDPENQADYEKGIVDIPPHFQKIIEFIQGPLMHDIKNMVRLNGRTEYQLAYFHPEGARYERHRDALPTDDPQDTNQRRITIVFYLNPGWVKDHGGEVKIFSRPDDHGLPEGAERIVKPLLGRILLLLSGAVDHEIMPCKHSRYALTAWLR
ncbi:unnamed protein product [Mucor circinelloides]|uniref:Fe2OG dioxygenase domain-containing protein n=1 Tax=Mucor circinelloides f. circinelloides (strain 1006PhL) TaxID=1220926 RepID=S2JNL1_MUCC1|nr:hypothetical protein HMPREF1544_09066 [Mucor circinelloides 1006PhL]